MNEYHEYTYKIMDEFNLTNHIRVKDYLTSQRDTMAKVPKKSGVYFVVLPHMNEKEIFVYPGTGGYYKGRNPNVSIEILQDNWIPNADIVYIGKAGGFKSNGEPYKTDLKVRIRTLLNFGQKNDKAPHWGGRYLWQHRKSSDFRIYWYECHEDEDAIVLENKLILDFERQYGRIPFANLNK